MKRRRSTAGFAECVSIIQLHDAAMRDRPLASSVWYLCRAVETDTALMHTLCVSSTTSTLTARVRPTPWCARRLQPD
jgi:hypothetical protein